jgi:hypothetical protein
MLINQGIKIYLDDPSTAPDNPALGITAGVATLLEGTGSIPVAVTYYRNDLFPKKWNSGFSDKFDFRTHVRPQIIGDCTVVISNVNNYYSDLQSAGYELEGKRVEFVFYTDDIVGAYSPASPYFVKSVKSSATIIELNLAGIDSQQYIDISQPITGDTWEPVIIGDHEKGVWVSSGELEYIEIDSKSWGFVTFDIADTPDNLIYDFTNRTATNNVVINSVPKDTSITPTEYNYASDDLYYVADSGGGEGSSFKASSSTAVSNPGGHTINIDLVDIPVYTSGDWEIKSSTGEGSITTDVTTGILKRLDAKYYTDSNAAISTNKAYNVNGDVIPVDSYQVLSDYINITPKRIDSGSIFGYQLEEFESSTINSADTIQSTGTWTYDDFGVWYEKASGAISTTQSGLIENTIDRDISTSYKTTTLWSIVNPINPAYEARVCMSMLLTGELEEIESLISDIETKTSISGNAVIKSTTNIRAYYVWDNDGVYESISSPVASVLFEPSNQLVGDATKDNQSIVRNTPSGYYDDTSNMYTNYNREYYESTNKMFATGFETLATEDQFSGKKKATRIQLEIATDLRVDSISPIETQIDITIENNVYGIGMVSNSSGVQISDNIFTSVQGRPYNTFKLYQENISKLLNWSLNHKTKPEIGWGLAECVDANVNTLNTSTEAIRSQWTNPTELNTKKQIEILCRESWNPMVSENGAKSWYSFLDNIGAESPANSYVAPSDCGKINAAPFDEQDIYNVYSVEYDYDIATNTYLKSITITKPSQDAYSAEYVTGITDTNVASSIWNKCKVLYEVAGSEKKLPDNLSKLRHVYTEEVAVQHILNYIEFFGVNGSSVYNPNYLVVADHPIEHLFVSTPMSTIGYTSKGLWGGVEATGIVTGRKYNPGEPKRVQIESIVKPTFLVGRIIEDDANVDRVIEDDANTNRIIEV